MRFVTIGHKNHDCDYVMDGIHDEIEFQAAIDYAAITNRVVKVEDRTFVIIEGDLEIKAPIYGSFTLVHSSSRTGETK